MKNSILSVIITTVVMASICEGETPFHKDLSDKIKISLSQTEAAAIPASQKTNLLPILHSSTELISVIEFVLKLERSDTNWQQNIWTNRHYYHANADPLVNTFRVFDAMAADGQIHLCYQDGPRFCIEEISSQLLGSPSKTISRFDLAKIPIVPGWAVLTNAFFNISTNSARTLTAQGTGGTVLVWEFQNNEWVIKPESKPTKIKQRVHNQYEHWIFRSNQWLFVNKTTP